MLRTMEAVPTLRAARRGTLSLVATVLLLGHLLAFLPLPTSLSGIGAWIILALPGVLLAVLLFRNERSLVQALFGVAGGVALPALLLMALHALPGPLPWWLLLLACDALSLWLGWLLARDARQADQETRWQGGKHPARSAQWASSIALALVLLLGAAFRLPLLNASELQGDEARALLMAAGVLHGQDEVLLVHKKGPVEVLLPAGPLVLMERVNEGAARLPFALAGVGVLLGAYVVARRLFDVDEGAGNAALIGIIAAAVLALDGFMLAFSRIVQYQSVLLLMQLGALWLCWNFYAGGKHVRRDLLVAAALVAVGLLAHYDAVYVVPALALLVVAGAWRRRWSAREWAAGLLPPIALGSVLLASFFVPFVRHERFARTAEYLTERTGQESLLSWSYLFNNLPRFYNLAAFYNTTFQMKWLALALLAGALCWLVMYLRPRIFGAALMATLAAGAWILYQNSERFKIGPDGENGNWAIALFAPGVIGLVLGWATPMALRALALWFGLAFLMHSFLIVKPQTHFYTMMPPAALLIGLACARLAAFLQARRLGLLRLPFAAAGLGLVCLAAPYMYIVYVRQWPPYQLVFPDARPDIYRARYDDSLPQRGGYFGFPHHSGWKVVGDLYDRGVLHGDFNSNEEELVTGWYTRGAFRCGSKPVYYFVAARPRDPQDIPMDEIREEYGLWGYVVDNDEKILDIYTRLPVGEPQVLHADEAAPRFDAGTVWDFPTQRSLFEILPQQHINAFWDYDIRLRGVDLHEHQLQQGQRATLTLYWRSETPVPPGIEPLVEVRDASGNLVGEGRPFCGTVPSERWNIHRISGTAFTWTPDAALPPGEYSLHAGLREVATGRRLALAEGGESLEVGSLRLVGQAAAQR
jgi:4-amino-4-deoxy-L-arabinose transferase-like glycosyltransferase